MFVMPRSDLDMFTEADIPAKPFPNRKERRAMAKGKPSKGTKKDMRLKANRRRKGGRRRR